MDINALLKDKRHLFWALQFAGWSGWAMSFYLGVVVWTEVPPNYNWYPPTIATIGMLLTLALRALYRYMWEMALPRRIVAIVAGSYAAGLVWMSIRGVLFYNMFPSERMDKDLEGIEKVLTHFQGAVSAFWVMLVWSTLYFGIKNYMAMQEEKQRGLRALSMAHEAQLKMLRYQLNPHFLFNTLNAISTLILDRNNQLANVMVTRLSRFLRHTLDNDPMQKVTVSEEVEALRLYLDIEKVRFDERLHLEFDIEDAARDALVPSLLLQPLVENAIKYAISKAINGGSITIRAALRDSNTLCMQVVDDGPGMDLERGLPTRRGNVDLASCDDGSCAKVQDPGAIAPLHGSVGLANCRDRLKVLYGERQSFELSTTDPHGLTISICIPLETNGSSS